MCLFYTIPMPNIFFYKRETKYLTFPVFLAIVTSASADIKRSVVPDIFSATYRAENEIYH